MDKTIQTALEKIKKDMLMLSGQFSDTPTIYIGKTDDFNQSANRHQSEGYPILLRIAEGIPTNIAELENALIIWAKKEGAWICNNKNKGSGGNPEADKVYICLNSSLENDILYELDEVDLLGKEYPLQLDNEQGV